MWVKPIGFPAAVGSPIPPAIPCKAALEFVYAQQLESHAFPISLEESLPFVEGSLGIKYWPTGKSSLSYEGHRTKPQELFITKPISHWKPNEDLTVSSPGNQDLLLCQVARGQQEESSVIRPFLYKRQNCIMSLRSVQSDFPSIWLEEYRYESYRLHSW